ncbi:hypothetical protein BLL42_21255 [Pseudomonas frederiksbergensis]|uniref:Uncharacterized protein n=1 Tax=Pseudomonas frederiksbergensis TaxID=104087 RepID=A0A1J0EPV7_9PSED|nr:hypothetical protein [Pseudomonas frederiksbergensis]APC18129.1 hypothetical protein BLL42_21255 [Pseudomonas frederiksbergensis]
MSEEPKRYPIDAPTSYAYGVGTDDHIERSNGALYVHLNGKRAKLIGLQSLDFLIGQFELIRSEVFVAEPAADHQGEPMADERTEFEKAYSIPGGVYYSADLDAYRSMNGRAHEREHAIDTTNIFAGWRLAKAALAGEKP